MPGNTVLGLDIELNASWQRAACWLLMWLCKHQTRSYAAINMHQLILSRLRAENGSQYQRAMM